MSATYHWRRSADPRPVLFLDVLTRTDEGWRLTSFPAYEVIAAMAPQLT